MVTDACALKGMNRMQYLSIIYNVPPYIKLARDGFVLP
jgi:hypothetical protein